MVVNSTISTSTNFVTPTAFICVIHVLIHLNKMEKPNASFAQSIIWCALFFFQAHLPPTYWVEALHMATHLLNILPSTTLKNDTPYHRLFQSHPSYSHLRIFGCLCYPHLNHTHKLYPRSTPFIFLGYPSNHKGFHCLDLQTKKIIISRHVTFDESIFPFGSMTPNSSPNYDFLDVDEHNIFNDPLRPPPPIVPPTELSSTSSPIPTPTSQPQPNVTSTTSYVPSVAPIPPSGTTRSHHMTTRARYGICKPIQKLNLHTEATSPIPKNYSQAFRDPNWLQAMQDEYNALVSKGTWFLVPWPPNVNIVNCIWLFKKKLNADGSLARYKARLVANGRS